MSKKQAVPAALHAELSDYASLLRVLRTNSTLDVAAQLAKPSIPDDKDESEEADSALENSRPPTPTREYSAKSPTDQEVSAGTKEAPDEPSTRPRDTWTRWPLPPDEVHPTEWGFQEEIRSLAQQVLDCHYTLDVSQHDTSLRSEVPDLSAVEASSHYVPDLDGLSHQGFRILAEASSIHLERMLASLVSFAPAADNTLESRFEGVDWTIVLGAVSAAGLFDSSVIENAWRRLERIYGPMELPTIERQAHIASYRDRVLEYESQFTYTHAPYEKPSDEEIKDEGEQQGKRKRNLDLPVLHQRKRSRLRKKPVQDRQSADDDEASQQDHIISSSLRNEYSRGDAME